jgi:hypothetical protein
MKLSRHAVPVLALAALATASMWSLTSRAASGTLAAAPTSVAVVDMQKAINDSAEIKAKNEELKARSEARMGEINKLKAELESQVKAAELLPGDSPQAIRARADAIVKKQTLEAQFQAYKQLTDIESGDILGEIHGKLIKTIDAIAKREGIQLVLADDRGLVIPRGRSSEDVGGAINARRVLFADKSIDLTERVLTELNNEFSAGGAKPKQ